MSKLTHASLFSGIGGIDLAAEAAGFQTCAQVEVNPFVSPSSASDSLTQSSSETSEKSGGGDILKACGGRPTVLSGGFPCQPVSLAGKKLGSKDDRWLWPEYARLIRECKPSWIVAENVASLVSIPEFAGIYDDLRAEGYGVRFLHLRASDAGAPHVRKRCFIVANADRDRLQEMQCISGGHESKESMPASVCGGDVRETHPPDTARFTDSQTNPAQSAERGRQESRSAIPGGDCGEVWRLPDWKTHPSRVCRVDNGIPFKMDRHRLQALGNAVVPRVAFPIFECIARIERGELR